MPFVFDEKVFSSAVTAANFAQARVASTDAVMEYNGSEYHIVPETYGNEVDDADIQIMVKDYVDKLVAEDRPQADAQIAVPESFYFLPAVTQDDSEMNRMMNIYNSFCKAKVTLTFGEVEEVTDWSEIQNWLVIDGEEATINEEYVYNYAYELAARYDTLYYPRTFTTSHGNEIRFESSDYGYRLNKDGEAAQFLADIYSNTEVTREPVYERIGREDLC